MRPLYLIWILSILPLLPTEAQEIDFGSYDDYSLNVEPLGGYETLDFGQVISGEGLREIDLGDDPGMGILRIDGVRYLDVYISITKPDALYADDPGNDDEIPITKLEAAYSNNGENDYTSAKFFTNPEARFPILERQHAAPGPPPAPPREGVTPPEETAYIYIWGSIDVGNVSAGSYSSQINVTIEYN
ncbi:MAG: hypothetical protein ACOC4S_02460 [Balneolaceae bacterium]